jgi:hypothetical protein
MQGSTNGGDSKLHKRYLPWEGDTKQQRLLAEIPKDMAGNALDGKEANRVEDNLATQRHQTSKEAGP